jgi:hypothetical protein
MNSASPNKSLSTLSDGSPAANIKMSFPVVPRITFLSKDLEITDQEIDENFKILLRT